MKQLFSIIVLALLMPNAAFAHAVPLDSVPDSSVALERAPESVEIRFSERIDVNASRISVTGPSGDAVSIGEAGYVENDPYRVETSVRDDGEGAYLVNWSVVSSDDGHFTKGTYPFAVGEGIALDPSLSSGTEIVQITTLPEILGMTVELIGHGLLWAIVVLFALCGRSLVRRGLSETDTILIENAFVRLAVLASLLALVGSAFQILVKSKDLAVLHGSTLLEAAPQYLTTVAGEATVVRMLAAATFMVLALVFRRAIVRSPRFTWQEALLVVVLAVFAYFRAKVSHATANHFLPDISVAVNFVHLIEKDIWAGMLIILFLALAFSRTRPFFAALWRKASEILTFNLAAVSITASYIVWLHLKSFDNLLSTKWGEAFTSLLLIAVLLCLVRAYHACAHSLRPRAFAAWLPATLAAELVLAVMVVYASSAVIITSPPAEASPYPVFSEKSEGARIVFGAHPAIDASMFIDVDSAHQTESPAVALRTSDGSNIDVAFEKQYPGRYVFPRALIESSSSYELTIRVPQIDAYDAVARFVIPAGAYDPARYAPGSRKVDVFTVVMILIGAGGFLIAMVLCRCARRAESRDVRIAGRYVEFASLASLAASGLITASLIAILQSSGLQNPYRALCTADGNMWHMMLPMKAGAPLSGEPREGCMWGMGAYQYMFPERDEYIYYRSLPESRASVDFRSPPVAGMNSQFTVTVRDAEGKIPPLFVDMEKLIHVVVVSADQSVFAHIHPDDDGPLREEEIRDAAFELGYVFPKAGEYLVAVDYASGVRLESTQHRVYVSGAPTQRTEVETYTAPSRVGPFDIAVEYSQPFAGEVTTLIYTISQDGKPATLEPYLSAAMHIAAVKNDLTAFAHTHGEVHPPGIEPPPVAVRDGKIVHSMESMATPAEFSYPIDAHVIFPDTGLYTVWAQFKSEGRVYKVPTTVRVE